MRTLLTSLFTLSLLLPSVAGASQAPAPTSDDGLVQDDDQQGSGDTNKDDDKGKSSSGSDQGGGEEGGDEGDSLDKILQEPNEQSVKEEQEDVRSGKLDDHIGANGEAVMAEKEKHKRIIKTIQRKDFLKLGRFEITPNVAFVTNDPFLNRYILGSGFSYHFTEIFAMELNLGFSPDLGEADWKPLTRQLVDNNHVSPDLSPLTYFGNATFSFSPIYGKVAVSGKKIIRFDIFGAFGMGAVRTADDLEALGETNSEPALATQYQIQPTTNFGGGARIILNDSMAIRIEGRSLVYIETIGSTTLEMKNNFILQGGVSFFFPGMH
jgi:outer membrane beta-barrel protein